MNLVRTVIEHKSREEHINFLKNNSDAQFIVMDEESLTTVIYLYMQGSALRFSFVQIYPENESRFKVTRSVDGGIMLIDQHQTDLFKREATVHDEDMKNDIYKAVDGICWERESNGSYKGNSHHLSQEITEAVYLAVIAWLSRKSQKESQPIIG